MSKPLVIILRIIFYVSWLQLPIWFMYEINSFRVHFAIIFIGIVVYGLLGFLLIDYVERKLLTK